MSKSSSVRVRPNRLNLEETQQLFDFLQGTVPDGYHISADDVPRLTANQAWTAIWYLGNLYKQVNDYIERCEVCGDLYNSESGGMCLDFGSAPYHFCDSCQYSDQYAEKLKQCPNEFHKNPIADEVCPECLELHEETVKD